MVKRKVIPKRKPTLLFVDDLQSVHDYTSRVAKSIGVRKRTAFHPRQAEKILFRRMDAITKLMKKLDWQVLMEKNPKTKKALQAKIAYLKELRQKPFDLIVSDVNMPHGSPVGTKFALGVQRQLPRQKILMHSDDQGALDYLREKGIDYSVKRNQTDNEKELKTRIKQELWPKKFKRKLKDDDWF